MGDFSTPTTTNTENDKAKGRRRPGPNLTVIFMLLLFFHHCCGTSSESLMWALQWEVDHTISGLRQAGQTRPLDLFFFCADLTSLALVSSISHFFPLAQTGAIHTRWNGNKKKGIFWYGYSWCLISSLCCNLGSFCSSLSHRRLNHHIHVDYHHN